MIINDLVVEIIDLFLLHVLYMYLLNYLSYGLTCQSMHFVVVYSIIYSNVKNSSKRTFSYNKQVKFNAANIKIIANV